MLMPVEYEAADDVGGYLASAQAAAHMFVKPRFPQMVRPQLIKVVH
jgi:hypothetical protein